MSIKRCKRFLSLLCVVSLLISMGTISASANNSTEELEAISSSLARIEQMKSQYGLDNVDFSNLYIGAEIPAYEIVNYQLVEFSRGLSPIYYDGQLVAFAIHSSNQSNDGFTQITTAMVNEARSIVGMANAICLIYDSESCYLYADGQPYFLASSGYTDSSRNKLSDIVVSELSPQCTPCGPVEKIPVCGAVPCVTDYQISNMTYIPKGYSNLCWAATVACIGYRLSSLYYPAPAIASYYFDQDDPVDYNKSLDPWDADDILEDVYGHTYQYSSSYPTGTVILTHVQAGHPIYGRFAVVGAGTHACTIYGINMTGYIYIMDPDYGPIQATSQNISGVGYRYAYTSPVSYNTLYLAEYCYHE